MHDHHFDDDEVIKKAKEALKVPDDYWTTDDTEVWGITGPGKHRDSKPAAIAVFEAVWKELSEKYPDDFEIQHSSHWGFGWVDTIRCRILRELGEVTLDNITDAFHFCLEVSETDITAYEEEIMRAEYEAKLSSIREHLGNAAIRVPDDVEERKACQNILSWTFELDIEPGGDDGCWFSYDDVLLACFYLGYIERNDGYYDEEWWMEWLEAHPDEASVLRRTVQYFNNINQIALPLGG